MSLYTAVSVITVIQGVEENLPRRASKCLLKGSEGLKMGGFDVEEEEEFDREDDDDDDDTKY